MIFIIEFCTEEIKCYNRSIMQSTSFYSDAEEVHIMIFRLCYYAAGVRNDNHNSKQILPLCWLRGESAL